MFVFQEIRDKKNHEVCLRATLGSSYFKGLLESLTAMNTILAQVCYNWMQIGTVQRFHTQPHRSIAYLSVLFYLKKPKEMGI